MPGLPASNALRLMTPCEISVAFFRKDGSEKPESSPIRIGYNGVKFDQTGQNVLASTYLIQLQGKEYKSVWPANLATNKLELPMKGWRK